MRRKAAEGVIPTEIRVAIVWLRWNIGARRSREPLCCMMGLQAGQAQPVLVHASKRTPIRFTHVGALLSVLLFRYHAQSRSAMILRFLVSRHRTRCEECRPARAQSHLETYGDSPRIHFH